MRVLGIDLGSRFVKIVIFEGDKIVLQKAYDTFTFYKDFCRIVSGKLNVDFHKLNLGEVDKIVSTGYGRNNVNVESATVILELKAHTYGAIWQTKLQDFVLLDIGGQDSKVIQVKNGRMADMILNDKCAASCGRYLENMGMILGLKIDELGEHYKNPVELSSTCAVFGESELIGKVAEGFSVEQLAAGVNYSLFKRLKPMIDRFRADDLVATGGVSANKALVHYLETETCFKRLIIPKTTQFNGAIGCCVFAIEKHSKLA